MNFLILVYIISNKMNVLILVGTLNNCLVYMILVMLIGWNLVILNCVEFILICMAML